MSLSAAERNMLGVLSQVAGIGLKLAETYDSPTARQITGDLVESVERAIEVIFPNRLTQHEADAMTSILSLYQKMAIPYFGDAIVLTNMGLAILSDVLDLVKNPQRKEALDTVYARLTRAHKYWDRGDRHRPQHDVAGDAADKWNHVMEEVNNVR